MFDMIRPLLCSWLLMAACATPVASPLAGPGFDSRSKVRGAQVHAALCIDPYERFGADLLGFDAVLPVAVRIESGPHMVWMGGAGGLQARYYLPDGTSLESVHPERLARQLPAEAARLVRDLSWESGAPAGDQQRYLFFDFGAQGLEFYKGAMQRAGREDATRMLALHGLVEFNLRVDGDEARVRVGLVRTGAESGREVTPHKTKSKRRTKPTPSEDLL